MNIASHPLGRVISTAVGAALVIGLAGQPVLAVEPIATTIDMSWSGTPEDGDPFSATVTVTPAGPPDPVAVPTGLVTVSEGATTLGTCTLASGTCDVALTLTTVGDHTLTVSYPGDGVYAGSTTDKLVTVLENTLKITGVGLNYGTFYPYKDGYRDTVTARGYPAETITYTIRVYSPTNRLLKKHGPIATSGDYTWAWNGRNSSGTIYAPGKYRITQTIADGHTSQVFTNYVNLSVKRLYTYTKTITKDYAHRSAQSSNEVAWQFTLPSATIYKKLVFAVYAKSSPAGYFGPHDFTLSGCSRSVWDGECSRPWAYIGSSFAWRKITGSVTKNRSGTYVRLYAGASTRSNLKYGRVTVTYAVLK